MKKTTSPNSENQTCPCGSLKTLGLCCLPLISHTQKAPTAEALMRARYTAYTLEAIDFIQRTNLPQSNGKDDFDVESAKKWASQSKWLGLEVLSTKLGGPTDSEGYVEFIAHFEAQGKKEKHHEYAYFKKVDDTWFFAEGQLKQAPIVRESAKVGRNDPCTCGSGKKYKKCCAGA